MNVKKPTISLCMIVKNEEKFLPQCLESVKDVVDEMIIVDTGSTDNTIKIAKSFGAKVYEHPWKNSFSEARNYGLKFASCDWILQLDADEALKQEDIPVLKKAIENDKYDAVFVALMNETPVGWTKHYSQRLFKRGKARFSGAVHNQLVYSGKDLKTEIVIYHYGYNLSKEKMRKKFHRTEKLIRRQLAGDKTNPFTYMNLLRVLKSQHKYKQVITYGEKALQISRRRMTDPIRQMIIYDMVSSFIEEGSFKEAEKRARELIEEFPDNLDMFYALGHALVKQKRFEEAISVYKNFLRIQKQEEENPKFSLLIIDTYKLDHKVWAIISDCEYELAHFEKGIKAAEMAIKLNPDAAEYKIALARNLLKLKMVKESKRVLEQMEQDNSVEEEIYLKYAALCSQNPALGSSADVIKRGVEKHPDYEKLSHFLSNIVSEHSAAASKKEPTISLCMIVKNEEEFLPQCLESVKDVVDEMIIVDTGSTDNTIKIAKSFGAKVYEHPWKNSFSEARNYGLKFASCDWILQLDADEKFEREDIHLLRKAVNQDKYDAIYTALLNDSSNGWSKHYFQRLFRRGRARYKGIVHNQLYCDGETAWSEIRIYHYGYNLSREKMKKKYVRTENLLLKQIEEDETNPFYHQNYVRILTAQKRYEEAIKAAKRAFEICRDKMNDNNRQMISFDLTVALTNLGRHEEAEDICLDILNKNPENIDMIYAFANNKLKTGEYEEAVKEFKRFLDVLSRKKDQPKYEGLIVETYSFEHRVWACLSDAFTFLAKFDDALEAAKKALKIKPDNGEYHVIYARALMNCKGSEEALDYLIKVEKDKDPDVSFYLKWVEISKTKKLGNPEQVFNNALKKFPDSLVLNTHYAFYLESIDVEKAIKQWNFVLSIDDSYNEAYVHLANIYADTKEIEKLKDTVLNFLNKCTRPLFIKKMGALCIKVQEYKTGIEVLGKYLHSFPDDAETLADVATCYVKLGQFESALIGYKAALHLDPDNSSVISNLEKLEKIVESSL